MIVREAVWSHTWYSHSLLSRDTILQQLTSPQQQQQQFVEKQQQLCHHVRFTQQQEML